jgi:hypothetical protein
MLASVPEQPGRVLLRNGSLEDVGIDDLDTAAVVIRIVNVIVGGKKMRQINA